MTSQTPLEKVVSGNIRAEMARDRQTIQSLASLLGCSSRSASDRYHGRTTYTISEISKISAWLNTTPSRLMVELELAS